MPFEITIACSGCDRDITAVVVSVTNDFSCLGCGKALLSRKTEFSVRYIPGYIYILSNPQMPDLLKIGLTTRIVADRIIELNSATGVPAAFKIESYFESDDPGRDEKTLHKLLGNVRMPGKEFFKLPLDDAIGVARSVTGNNPVRLPIAVRDNPTWWRCENCYLQFFSIYGNCKKCGKQAIPLAIAKSTI